MKTLRSILAATALLVAADSAAAQSIPASTPPPPPISQLAKFEESFVTNLMQDFVVEGKAASGARNRATKPEVRELGTAIGNDYPKMAEDLSIFATKKSIVLPADLEASHQKVVDALSSVSVDEFDSAYVALTIDNQTRYLAQIQPILSTTNDPELKVLLGKLSAQVATHLAQAKAVQQKYAGVSLDANATVPK